MSSKFFFSLNTIKPQKKYAEGNITDITSDHVSGFQNISFSSLVLNKGGAQMPIWHPNANKIGYCVDGQALISIRSPKNVETFTVQKGDLFFVPKGFAHNVVNIGEKQNVIAFALNHNKPEVMNLSNAIYSLSDPVFTATFNTQASFYDGLKKSKNTDIIGSVSSVKKPQNSGASSYKFNIAESKKVLMTKGGYLQLGTKPNLPILDGLGILGFGLNPKGVVEPHWHTNAGELVYIVKGKTKITVLAPDGSVEVLQVNGGEGAFAPASYFHNIENVGNDDVEVIAFFSHAEPDYIGIGEVVGSFSNDVLGSVFNVAPSYFDSFQKTEEPLVIVPV